MCVWETSTVWKLIFIVYETHTIETSFCCIIEYNKENEIPELRVGTYTWGVEMKIKEKEEKEREE